MKKRIGTLTALLLSFVMAFSLLLAGCGGNPGEEGGDGGDGEYKVTYRTGYTPTSFSLVSSEATQLGDGVYLVANTLKMKNGLMNGKTSVVYTIEVDLTKANVVAGTKDNSTAAVDGRLPLSKPYQTALDWEAATGGHAYASINADFFDLSDPGLCLNAFVKDGVIIKDSHNDTGVPGVYDYKNLNVDVPASAPMLFGVKGETAQIAPIINVAGDPTDPSVKEQFLKARLSYAIVSGPNTFNVSENTSLTSLGQKDLYLYTGTAALQQTRGFAVKVDTTKGLTALEVLEVIDQSDTSVRVKPAAGEGYAWLLNNESNKFTATGSYLGNLKVGDTVSLSVQSPDGAWNGYETILGCRQALVINDAVASTVTLENSNRAQEQEVPRTAVGIKNGKVVLIAVESMYYYGKDNEGDTHGVNLPELAEFAYYYGCSDAANFDGGGSTHLVVHPDGEDARLLIRSADYDTTTDLFTTRAVYNSFLITSRV